MERAALAIVLIFAVPLTIAYLLGWFKDREKEKKRLEREWRAKLRAKELKLGRRLTIEEIQLWLIHEWFKDRIRNAEDFAKKIQFDLIDRR